MFNLTESLVYYVNAIGGNYTVLTRLRNHAQRLNFMEDTIEVLDDIMIDNNQCLRQGEIYSEVLSNLMDARGTLINNNMNILLKKLTIINVVFLPLNLIASIGGMSEYGMITKGIGWGLAYSLFFIAMALIGGFTAFLLGRMSFAGNSSEDIKKKLKRLKNKAPMSPNEC